METYEAGQGLYQMNRIITFFTIILIIISLPVLTNAQDFKTAYVSDILILTVRTGPARNFEVFKTIQSDEQLLILEEKNGFSKIKLSNGDTGWVQSQYLSFETPDPIIISRLNIELNKLKIKNRQQLKTIESLHQKSRQKQIKFQNEKNAFDSTLSQTITDKKDFINKYSNIDKKYNELLEKSKHVVKTSKENEKLKQLNKELITKLEGLGLKNKTLLKVGMIKWFLAGAGVIFLGWIIGRSVSTRGSRRSGLLR